MIKYDKDGIALYIRPVDSSGAEPVPLPLGEIHEIEIEVYNRYKKTNSKLYKLSDGDMPTVVDGFLLIIEPEVLKPFLPGELIVRRTYSMANAAFDSGYQNFTKRYLLGNLKKI